MKNMYRVKSIVKRPGCKRGLQRWNCRLYFLNKGNKPLVQFYLILFNNTILMASRMVFYDLSEPFYH